MRSKLIVANTDPLIQTVLSEVKASEHPVGIDTETVGIDPKKESPVGNGRVVCWSVAYVDPSMEYDPDDPSIVRCFLWASALDAFKPWLQSDTPKVGHNAFTFDRQILWNHGIVLRGLVGDTLRMSRLLYSDKRRKHGLKALSKNWLGIEQPSFSKLFTRPAHSLSYVQETVTRKGEKHNVSERRTKRKVGEQKGVDTLMVSGERGFFGKAVEFIPLDRIPVDYPERTESLYEYASLDAELTLRLYFKMRSKLESILWEV